MENNSVCSFESVAVLKAWKIGLEVITAVGWVGMKGCSSRQGKLCATLGAGGNRSNRAVGSKEADAATWTLNLLKLFPVFAPALAAHQLVPNAFSSSNMATLTALYSSHGLAFGVSHNYPEGN